MGSEGEKKGATFLMVGTVTAAYGGHCFCFNYHLLVTITKIDPRMNLPVHCKTEIAQMHPPEAL